MAIWSVKNVEIHTVHFHKSILLIGFALKQLVASIFAYLCAVISWQYPPNIMLTNSAARSITGREKQQLVPFLQQKVNKRQCVYQWRKDINDVTSTVWVYCKAYSHQDSILSTLQMSVYWSDTERSGTSHVSSHHFSDKRPKRE